MEPYPYIVVEGNIGSGKTTLVQKLSAYLNARAFYEEFSDNPFLPKFYSDPEKHAFPLELSFLAERYHQLKNELNSRDLFHKSIISDYYLSKSLIFAEINLPEDEFNLYNSLFSIIHQKLPKPSLYIYLYSDVDRLQINIKARGRAYEMEIEDSYLAQIQESYLLFINQQTDFPVLLLNTTKIDFVNSVSDFESIVSCLNKEYSKGVHRIML
jgi:deoxyguanosine kinase